MSLSTRIPWSTIFHVKQKDLNDKSKILAEGDVIKIRLAGHDGECVMRKASLVEKSGFFRTMLSSNFQEANAGLCTLHDDHPAGLVIVLRYILDEEQMGGFSERGTMYRYLSLSKVELLVATFITADKYDVAGLREMVGREIGQHSYSLVDFLQMHYDPSKQTSGGNYLEALYPAFAMAWERYNKDAAGVSVGPYRMPGE